MVYIPVNHHIGQCEKGEKDLRDLLLALQQR